MANQKFLLHNLIWKFGEKYHIPSTREENQQTQGSICWDWSIGIAGEKKFLWAIAAEQAWVSQREECGFIWYLHLYFICCSRFAIICFTYIIIPFCFALLLFYYMKVCQYVCVIYAYNDSIMVAYMCIWFFIICSLNWALKKIDFPNWLLQMIFFCICQHTKHTSKKFSISHTLCIDTSDNPLQVIFWSYFPLKICFIFTSLFNQF